MTILQPSTNATNAAATEGNVKSFLGNLRAFVAELIGTDSDNKQAAQAALQTPMHGSLPKSSGYTVTAADRGKIITAGAALTLNVTAAATLGDGFVFGVWAKGGAVTIDPSLAEQIDGSVTKVIGAGKCALVYCDGSAFATVGVGFSLADLLAVDGSGSGLDADTLDGQHASAFAPASHTHNYTPLNPGLGGVGSYYLGICSYVNHGSTVDGNQIRRFDTPSISAGLSGTWMAMSQSNESNSICLLLRIA